MGRDMIDSVGRAAKGAGLDLNIDEDAGRKAVPHADPGNL